MTRMSFASSWDIYMYDKTLRSLVNKWVASSHNAVLDAGQQGISAVCNANFHLNYLYFTKHG